VFTILGASDGAGRFTVKLKLAETFQSIQGEGPLAGVPMHFIRFAGCTVKECPLHPAREGVCDTDWSCKEVVEGEQSLDDLAKTAVENSGASKWVSITGGEPCDQPKALAFLCSSIRRMGGKINLQTSGTREVDCEWDWLTVSPKCSAADLKQGHGNELKVVITGQLEEDLRAYYNTTRFWKYTIQPLWSGKGECNKSRVLDLIKTLNRGGQPWELSLQTHKYIGVP